MATKRRPLGGRQVRPFGGGPVRPFGGRVIRPPAGRPVMITGAASGIGRSLARHLSRLGSPVAPTPTSSTPWPGSPPPTTTT